jgi:hypothetical protein
MLPWLMIRLHHSLLAQTIPSNTSLKRVLAAMPLVSVSELKKRLIRPVLLRIDAQSYHAPVIPFGMPAKVPDKCKQP